MGQVLAKGEIHDLGYKRYVGARRPPSTRWRVIMRHQIASGWKSWWRYKAALAWAVVMTCIWGGLLLFMSDKTFQMGGAKTITQYFSEAALPMSIVWFARGGFYLSVVLGATAIAGDLQSGAFTFYFARSTRPRDYVLGKLAGYGFLVATLVMIGPLVIAGLRLGICDTTSEVVAHLWLLPASLAVGAVMTIAYAVVPLGFSALLPDRRNALALWAAYYLVFGFVMMMIGRFGNSAFAAFDLPTACEAIAFDLFDFAPIFGRRAARGLSPEIALLSIAIHAGVAITILWWRVSRAQKSGVGGSS